jgi:tetratricopeptide (TPR) repeat protein
VFKGKLTQQSDQYSLAVTYYHLRTGRLLFKGDQAQMMYAHLELEPDLSQLPPPEGAVLARALSKEPGKRWRNCNAFVNELTNAQQQAKEEECQRQEAERRRQEQERQKREATTTDVERVWRDLLIACTGDDYEERIACCNEAIHFNINLRVVFNIRGNSWRRKKEYDRAIRDFDEALRHDPQLAITYINRGTAWLDKKEYDKARKDFDEAIRVDPEDADTYQSIAWLLATWPEEKVRDGKRAIYLATKACELRVCPIRGDFRKSLG